MNTDNQKEFEFQHEAKKFFGWTPHPQRWFEILGWITSLSALKFFAGETESLYLLILYYVSYAILYNYLQELVLTTKYQAVLKRKVSPGNARILTYLVALILVACVYIFVSGVVADLSKTF